MLDENLLRRLVGLSGMMTASESDCLLRFGSSSAVVESRLCLGHMAGEMVGLEIISEALAARSGVAEG